MLALRLKGVRWSEELLVRVWKVWMSLRHLRCFRHGCDSDASSPCGGEGGTYSLDDQPCASSGVVQPPQQMAASA